MRKILFVCFSILFVALSAAGESIYIADEQAAVTTEGATSVESSAEEAADTAVVKKRNVIQKVLDYFGNANKERPDKKFDVSFINNTPDAITLSILWPGDNNRQLITIGGNSTSKVSSSMYPIDAYVVNNDQNLMRDNAYAVEMIDFRCAISTQNPNVWTVKNQLSDAQLSGDERLFLAEKTIL